MAARANGGPAPRRARVALRTQLRPGSGGSRAQARELRILGDEDRGFILAGAADLVEDDEFWFATLAEAIAAAERLAVDPGAWERIDG